MEELSLYINLASNVEFRAGSCQESVEVWVLM